MSAFDVLIIGLGNVGRRHLQAVNNIENIDNVTGIDTSPESITETIKFCEDNDISRSKINFADSIHRSTVQINRNTIVIISTTANVRSRQLHDVIKMCPRAIIAEKPLTQTLTEYENIEDDAKKYDVPVYVNFVSHYQPIWKKIKDHVNDAKDFTFVSNLSNEGLACVGIHRIELFCWLFNLNEINITNTSFTSIYPTKRKGFTI